MPENQIMERLWGLGPWLLGLVVVALRNEWTTKQMQKAIYDPQGDVRVVSKADCNTCRTACQKAFTEALAAHSAAVTKDRDSHKAEIERLHDKIDKLPGDILNLLRGYHVQ